MQKQFLLTLSVLLAGACAHHTQTETSHNEEDAEVAKAIARDSDVLVEQDMGYLTLREKSEKELLREMNTELKDSERSLTDENVQAPTSQQQKEVTKAIDLFNADSVIVEKGDTLGTVAQKHLGASNQWPLIAALNPKIRNPNNLEVGQKLYVPANNRSIASLSHELDKIVPMVDKPDTVTRSIASVEEPKVAAKAEPVKGKVEPKAEPKAKEVVKPKVEAKVEPKAKVEAKPVQKNATAPKKPKTPTAAAPSAASLPLAYAPLSVTGVSHDISDLMKERAAEVRFYPD